ncbi:uncharacterized protein LOC126719886 [Quercus robur]|uniref:uncharacterized protein LOC126719886 n=1 Tax=Quercus robur TaxID=38942 RepID=UPI002161A456|nr:uncharacterized protein LOC126719886 [Quercus robur]
MDLVDWHSPILMVITETRMSGARADEIIKALPFDGYAVADTIGFAGGIWLLWRTDLVHVEVLAATEQEIHALIQVRSQSFSWLISAIYASPRFEERCILWNNLKILANMHDLPWALMGDFNEVLAVEEKYGGNPICQRRGRAIKECMDECRMMDLGYTVVRDARADSEGDLAEAISNFKTKAQNWNRELSEEYNLILELEEELWAMKSRTSWIISGERNTTYFHISALNRRSKNRIICVQNSEGEWCRNLEELKEIFNSSFKKLYQSEQVFCPITTQWSSDWCAKLSQEEAGSLTNIPSDGEIWNALKTMKPYKAPGIDGLHAGFFQRFWLVVGESVKREVKEVFSR